MATMSRSLRNLLEPGFADGYDQFKEVVDYLSDDSRDSLTPEQKVWIRLFELVSVAMIEGMNKAETEQEIPPHTAIYELWSAVGSALGTVNAQAFQLQGKGNRKVRSEMMKALQHGYDRTIKGLTEGVPA